MRFEIIRAPAARPLLALFGATAQRSFVDVDDASVRLRFGAFDETVARMEIVSAESVRWPLLAGVGWRLVSDGVGLIGTLKNVVGLRLRSRRTVKLFPLFSVGAQTLYVSVDRPDELIALLAPPPRTV